MVGFTALVLVFVCLLLSRLERSLEICSRATSAVFTMPGLLLMPMLSMAVSLVAIGGFCVVAAYLTTPDPALILQKLNELTTSVATTATDLANQGLASAHAAAQQGLDAASDASSNLDVHLDDLDVSLEAPSLAITSIHPQTLQTCAVLFEGFVALWVLFFFDAIVYTTIAAAVGYWYFVGSAVDEDGDGDVDDDGLKDKSFFPMAGSLCRVLRYHLGSMAMGSFVLAAVRSVRLLMLWLDEQMKRPGFRDSFTVQLAMKCIHCVLWCFEQCVKFLTRFTYVFVALEGMSFCSSAVQTFKLTSQYPLQMLANEAARAVLALLQTLLPPLCCASLAYTAVLESWRDVARAALPSGSPAVEYLDLQPWVTPPSALAISAAVLGLSYYITNSFKIVYGAAVDTLFVCMFRDDASFDGRYASKAAHRGSVAVFMDGDRKEGSSSAADLVAM